MGKGTFATEGVKPRNILTEPTNSRHSASEKAMDRKPKDQKLGKNPLKTYVTDKELQGIKEKAGGVPLATHLRNFLRENGYFD